MLDSFMVDSCSVPEVMRRIHIGLLCVQDDPAERPTMSSVFVMLASDTIVLPQPQKPIFSIGQFVGRSVPSSSASNPKICSVNDVTLSNVSPR